MKQICKTCQFLSHPIIEESGKTIYYCTHPASDKDETKRYSYCGLWQGR